MSDYRELISRFIEEHSEQMAEDIMKILAVESVAEDAFGEKPLGKGVADALDLVISLCREYGFSTKNIDYYCARADYGTGEESVGILTHLDTVPIGDGWTRNPLGQWEGNRIYGRGAMDNKGQAIAALYAARAVAASGIPLKRKLELIFGCDEERGMEDISYYLTKEAAPTYAFSPDAEFPVIKGEKHIFIGNYTARIDQPTILAALSGGTRSNVVSPTASAILKGHIDVPQTERIDVTEQDGNTCIHAIGVPVHASTPEDGGISAIGVLLECLVDVLPEHDGAFRILHGLQSRIGGTFDGKGLGIACSDEATGSLTMNLGVMNLVQDQIHIEIDIRHPVTLDYSKTFNILRGQLKNMGFEAEKEFFLKGLYYEEDHPLVRSLMEAYSSWTADDTPPITMGGGTYARTLPCAVAFGGGFLDQESVAHKADEYVELDRLILATKIFADAMIRLCNI